MLNGPFAPPNVQYGTPAGSEERSGRGLSMTDGEVSLLVLRSASAAASLI